MPELWDSVIGAFHLVNHGQWKMPTAAFVAAIATYLLAFPARALGRRLGVVAVPTARSSHDAPIPRTGGVAIILGILIGVAAVFKPNLPFVVAALVGGVVMAISFIDDVRNLPPVPRLIIQIFVAAMAIGFIKLIPRDLGLPYITRHVPEWFGFFLATVYVVGFMNAFNFMDGIDGLAASQGLWGGVTISLLLYFGHSGNSVYTASALAGACFGFLPHNFPRAKIFLGDLGAVSLGFGLAMLTLIGGTRSQLPLVGCVLPLTIFIYDPAFTVVKRVLKGNNPFLPHREFHFHLLLRSGWDHDRVTRLQNGLMILASAAGWAYSWNGNAVRLAILGAVVAGLALYSLWVHWYFATHRTDLQPASAPQEAL